MSKQTCLQRIMIFAIYININIFIVYINISCETTVLIQKMNNRLVTNQQSQRIDADTIKFIFVVDDCFVDCLLEQSFFFFILFFFKIRKLIVNTLNSANHSTVIMKRSASNKCLTFSSLSVLDLRAMKDEKETKQKKKRKKQLI